MNSSRTLAFAAALLAPVVLWLASARFSPTPPPRATTLRSHSPDAAPAASAAPASSAKAGDPAPSSPPLPEDAYPGLLSFYQVRWDPPLRSLVPTPEQDPHLPLTVTLAVESHRRLAVKILRHEITGPDAGVLTGEVEGRPGSLVVLSYVGLAQAGVVQLPDEARSYVINGDDHGRVRIAANDLTRAPACAPPLVPPAPTTSDPL